MCSVFTPFPSEHVHILPPISTKLLHDLLVFLCSLSCSASVCPRPPKSLETPLQKYTEQCSVLVVWEDVLFFGENNGAKHIQKRCFTVTCGPNITALKKTPVITSPASRSDARKVCPWAVTFLLLGVEGRHAEGPRRI